ncbi:protein quiver-like [Dreissena polymorpha]|uniref:Protein quiver n=1 Tax=Dreissena polymorpha TaxID=45954 RepID=A0A9D3YDZ6_DREPO|nr:protein quiver-like [Dreissena polymorpha]KAH3697046.1 hypothetical protein DPMN_084531 [Dreissena polymorpha]
MKCFTLVIVILSLYAGYAAAIRCFECDSDMNSTCADTFEASGFQPKDNCTSCEKVKGKKEGIQFVGRTCDTSALPDKCHSETIDGVDGDVCWCSKDLCNSALSVFARLSLILGLLVRLIF